MPSSVYSFSLLPSCPLRLGPLVVPSFAPLLALLFAALLVLLLLFVALLMLFAALLVLFAALLVLLFVLLLFAAIPLLLVFLLVGVPELFSLNVLEALLDAGVVRTGVSSA
jgi:hypothetical protein